MANDIKSAELCLNAVQALEEQLRGARKTLINSETCVVNRGIMSAQLEYLKDNLPQTVKIAAKIVAEEETIRSETEQKRKEIIDAANTQAQNTLSESTQKAHAMMEQANQEANALMDRANQEAAACVDAARAEAQRLVQDAEKKAAEEGAKTGKNLRMRSVENQKKLNNVGVYPDANNTETIILNVYSSS